MEKAYTKGKLNAELYSRERLHIQDFFESERYYLSPDYIRPGTRILDIGGGAGGLGNAIMESIQPDIHYTCIDPDSDVIKIGRRNMPDSHFIEGYFPENLPGSTYDLVIMFVLFPQIPNWKETLIHLAQYSDQYINISLIVKMKGTTVVDKDVSYVYYLDSGERVHQVIHNIYELRNFCCIKEMRVRKIRFFGYHTQISGDNYRCIPNREQIKGNLFLELFDWKENPDRMGGGLLFEGKNKKYTPFRPDTDIVIDGKTVDIWD